MRIREVNGAVWTPTLLELHRETLPADSPCDFGLGWWWIAFDGDRPVAFAGMTPVKSWAHTVYLKRAGVLESHRGKHLQRRLIQSRINKARKLGMVRVITDTFLNPPSANNLIACGFRQYEPENGWSFPHAAYWYRNV